MNMHLKEYPVECVGATQLVNDKKYLKKRSVSSESPVPSTTASSSSSGDAASSAAGVRSVRSNVSLRSSGDISSTGSSAANVPSVASNVTLRSRSTVTPSDANSSSSIPERYAMPAEENTDNLTPLQRLRLRHDQQKLRQAVERSRLEGSILQQMSSSQTSTTATSSDVILQTRSLSDADNDDAQSMRDQLTRGDAKQEEAKTTGGDSQQVGVEITLGQYESVPSPGSTADNSKSPAAFAHVKLRPVHKNSLKATATMQTDSVSYDSFSSGPSGLTTTSKSETKEGNESSNGPSVSTSKNEEAEQETSEPTTDSKKSITRKDVEVRLVPTNGDEARVIVGKKHITRLQSESTVVWKLPRSQIQSLSLEMATLQVILVLLGKDNKKTLLFESSEECLMFANAFYDMDDDEASVPSSVQDDNESDTEVSLLETLNDEEQKVLEAFRRLRKTTSAEDALQKSLPVPPVEMIDADAEIADKYRRMIRMSVPLQEVQNKMIGDGIDSKVMQKIIAEANAQQQPPQFLAGLPSSPVSTFSSSCAALSSAEVETVNSYKKMLRMHIPLDAVKHKMKKDQVDPKIVACVLGDDTGSKNNDEGASVDSALTEDEQNVVQGYRKMLKMSFPEEVIRHKMKRDQVSEKIVRAVFPSLPQTELSTPESAIVAKYKKMLSMGVEKDGVRHKMVKDEIDPKIINAVVGSDEKAAPQAPFRKKTLALSAEEESVASQYRKLLKLQIPRDSVMTRMQGDGVSEKIIKAVLGMSSSSSQPTDETVASGKSKLVALHWTPISGKDLDDSVWSRANKKREDTDAETTGPAGSDITNLINLFQKKTKAAGTRKKRTEGSSSDNAKLLDLTRSNNVAISLKAFKDVSHKELAMIIQDLDPHRKIRGERVQFIRDLLPTTNEVKLIRDYDGSESRLVPAEIWFRHIAHIKRIETKAQVLRTMEMFRGEAEMVMSSLTLLTEVCKQVVESEKLRDLLEMVLSIGNIMNEGTRTGGASGFKFDSLLRLTQTKSSDGKTTVLDFLVTCFVEKGQRDSLNLSTDFPQCQTASRMMISDLLKDVKGLGESLEQCKSELEAMREDAAPRTHKTEESTKACPLDPRAALLSALKAKGHVPIQAAKSEGFAQRDRFLSTVEAKNSALHENATSPGAKSEEAKSDTQLGIDRLQRFIDQESETFTVLQQQRDQALDACRQTSKYCGESGGVGSTAPLLGVLSQFATNLEEAVKKYDRQQAAANRKKQKGRVPSSASTVNTVEASTANGDELLGEKQSLVVLVSEMLKSANDRTKEDFRKGRFKENPSSTLKTIYDREQLSTPMKCGEPLDLVSSIREREGKVNKEDFREARFRFAGVSPSSAPKKSEDQCGMQQHSVVSNTAPRLRPMPESKRSKPRRRPPTPDPFIATKTRVMEHLSTGNHSDSEIYTRARPKPFPERQRATNTRRPPAPDPRRLVDTNNFKKTAPSVRTANTEALDSTEGVSVGRKETSAAATLVEKAGAKMSPVKTIPSVADAIKRLNQRPSSVPNVPSASGPFFGSRFSTPSPSATRGNVPEKATLSGEMDATEKPVNELSKRAALSRPPSITSLSNQRPSSAPNVPPPTRSSFGSRVSALSPSATRGRVAGKVTLAGELRTADAVERPVNGVTIRVPLSRQHKSTPLSTVTPVDASANHSKLASSSVSVFNRVGDAGTSDPSASTRVPEMAGAPVGANDVASSHQQTAATAVGKETVIEQVFKRAGDGAKNGSINGTSVISASTRVPDRAGISVVSNNVSSAEQQAAAVAVGKETLGEQGSKTEDSAKSSDEIGSTTKTLSVPIRRKWEAIDHKTSNIQTVGISSTPLTSIENSRNDGEDIERERTRVKESPASQFDLSGSAQRLLRRKAVSVESKGSADKAASRQSLNSVHSESSLLINLARRYSLEKSPADRSTVESKSNQTSSVRKASITSPRQTSPSSAFVPVTSKAREGESSVARMARERREEKAKAKASAGQSPPVPSLPSAETAMARMARQRRIARKANAN